MCVFMSLFLNLDWEHLEGQNYVWYIYVFSTKALHVTYIE